MKNKIIKREDYSQYLQKPFTQLRHIQHPKAFWYQEGLDNQCHERVLKLTRGIYLMEEWWQNHNIQVTYPITEHTSYSLFGLKKLEKYTRQFHQALAPHIHLDDKHLVFGIGATHILIATMYALCIQHSKANKKQPGYLSTSPLYFTHQLPGYLGGKEWIDISNSFNAHWVDIKDAKSIDPQHLVEFVTSPNNPTGKILHPLTQAKHVIYDRVNHWPFYMTNSLDHYFTDDLMTDEITIYSLPKILSFSGSRVGYAFIKDKKIAEIMHYFIINSTHGIAIDGQIRCLTALQYLINNNLINEYSNWLFSQLKQRWKLLKTTLKLNDIELLNSQGPNAWIKTPTPAEEYLYKKFRIIATYGPEYGASTLYARLNLTCASNEFNELIYRLTHT